MTTDQAVARQAAHDNLVHELMNALQAIVELPAHPMRKKAVEIAAAALARAKERQ
ncbi:hypothetical protein HTY52_08105 [Cupriavidus taiwanensis]|uniref:hypothetical protein n=1 Tax=Cupriavidus taiwanensis TaxID=164546 RepID=UPI00157225E7|nr:hypothetical protein [Cupriavidus taiwanensis]NSX14033.1 hypothetical protein [Cupriavidus taiwanensis]